MKKTLSQNEKKLYEYIIKVLSSSVNETSTPLPYEGINWKNVISYSDTCGVKSIVLNTISKLPKEYFTEEIRNEIKERINKEILVDCNLNYEIEKLLKVFEKYKIKNLPLKGYFMKMEYPRSDFREVCDFDILFDVKQADELKKAFAEAGYEFLHNDEDQYHFSKKPIMYIEMHASLVHGDNYCYDYLKNQLDNSTKRQGYEYSYEMSVEDYYLYMMVHNSTHFRKGGMGIRMLLDTYVYYRNHSDEFDFEYLDKMLRLYKLDKFEKKARKLAFDWFSTDTPKITFDDFDTYIFLSAIIGRLDASIMINSRKAMSKENQSGKNSKFTYLRKSLFPKKSYMTTFYPYLEKAPFMLPWTWCCMWCKRFFIERNVNVKRGIKNRLSYTDEDVNYIKDILNEVEFNDFE